MIQLFLHWLRLIGIGFRSVTFRLSVHRSADVEAALAYWSEVVGAPAHSFLATTLKRHNPATRRRRIGPDYRGCFQVTVRRSIDMNRRVDAWFSALVEDLERRQRPSKAARATASFG